MRRSTPPPPSRNIMPLAATGCSASKRDRMPGHDLGDILRVSAYHDASAGHAAAVERQSGVAIRGGTTSPGFAVLVPTHRHADVTSELNYGAAAPYGSCRTSRRQSVPRCSHGNSHARARHSANLHARPISFNSRSWKSSIRCDFSGPRG